MFVLVDKMHQNWEQNFLDTNAMADAGIHPFSTTLSTTPQKCPDSSPKMYF
jgi:hypothetical protein